MKYSEPPIPFPRGTQIVARKTLGTVWLEDYVISVKKSDDWWATIHRTGTRGTKHLRITDTGDATTRQILAFLAIEEGLL